MEVQQVHHIIECLPKGRTIFYHFRDRHALELLSGFVGRGRPVAEVKESPFGKLLNRPIVKALCAWLGGTVLSASDLLSAWPAQPQAYLLTLSRWPQWPAGAAAAASTEVGTPLGEPRRP